MEQATVDVVDAALRHGRPFAVVPCCVFAHLFPERRLRDGKAVAEYDPSSLSLYNALV